MKKLNKDLVKKTIHGYEKGAAFARKQRLKQLRFLSTEDSLEIFTGLYKTWEKSKPNSGVKTLDSLKIKYLIELRRRINKLAQWKQANDRTA